MSSESERMRYGILGDDDQSTEEKLSKYCGEVTWDYLKPHYETGSLYFLDSSIKLENAGAAISEDDKETVAVWLKSGDLVKIEALHVQQWEDSEQKFEALVVSPFVLCRPI